jgi:hypothetical protein
VAMCAWHRAFMRGTITMMDFAGKVSGRDICTCTEEELRKSDEVFRQKSLAAQARLAALERADRQRARNSIWLGVFLIPVSFIVSFATNGTIGFVAGCVAGHFLFKGLRQNA